MLVVVVNNNVGAGGGGGGDVRGVELGHGALEHARRSLHESALHHLPLPLGVVDRDAAPILTQPNPVVIYMCICVDQTSATNYYSQFEKLARKN